MIHNGACSGLPELSSSRILLFLADEEALEKKSKSIPLHWLSREETVQYRRYRSEHLRTSYLYSRLIMRILLGGYTGMAPSEVSFGKTEKGKPYVSGLSDVTFNLSRSGSHIALAIGKETELGVDIEHYDPDKPVAELASRTLTPDELRHFSALPTEIERMEYFFRMWTLKEACLKASGEGITAGLNNPAVTSNRGSLQYTLPRYSLALAWMRSSAILNKKTIYAFQAERFDGEGFLWKECDSLQLL